MLSRYKSLHCDNIFLFLNVIWFLNYYFFTDLRIILGNVNVSILNKDDKYEFICFLHYYYS